MDRDNEALTTKSPENSLTESWNVIESQDINNISEGSDGESIEVIDEDTQNTSSIKESYSIIESCKNSKSDEVFDGEPCGIIPDLVENRESRIPTREYGSETQGVINLLNTFGLIALFFGVVFTGATFSLFLLKVEELATDTFSYFSPSKSADHDYEYQDLLNQIKAYKEESRDLKNILADLNSAVLTLKNELASQKHAVKSELEDKNNYSPEQKKSEDTLFEQILNVHTDNDPNRNYSHELKMMPHEDYFMIIKETLLSLVDEKKMEDEMETVRIFSQIPMHLSVLTNFDSTNIHINKFIEIWKDKLLKANEKLVNDIKQMQLKMTRHIIKSLKSTQKTFFEKLCELKDMNKPECYETFIKPYQYANIYLPDKNNGKKSCFNVQKNKNSPESDKIKNNCAKNDPSAPKKKQTTGNKESNFNRGRQYENENMNSKNNNIPITTLGSENDDGKYTETNFVPGDLDDTTDLEKNKQNSNKKKSKSQINTEKNIIGKKMEKGMKSELAKDPNLAVNNSFSSFSAANHAKSDKRQNDRTEWEKNPRYEDFLSQSGERSSWFLRMGKHRSKIRRIQARGDWLFERARYRQRRSYFQ